MSRRESTAEADLERRIISALLDGDLETNKAYVGDAEFHEWIHDAVHRLIHTTDVMVDGATDRINRRIAFARELDRVRSLYLPEEEKS